MLNYVVCGIKRIVLLAVQIVLEAIAHIFVNENGLQLAEDGVASGMLLDGVQ